MRTAVDVRKYRETMREQGKSSLGEARRFVSAWVGATDLAYDRVRTELKDLPARNRAQVERLQKRAKKNLNGTEVRKHLRAAYEDLAERGEVVIRRMRNRPHARLVFTKPVATAKHTDKVVETAERPVTRPSGTAEKAATDASQTTDRKPMNGRRAAPHKATAHKGSAHR